MRSHSPNRTRRAGKAASSSRAGRPPKHTAPAVQAAAGNMAMGRLLHGSPRSATPAEEKDASKAAHAWMNVPPSPAAPAPHPKPLSATTSAAPGGEPLPEDTRAEFESHTGADLSGVRVHDDAEAVAITRASRAKALTVGSSIFFAPGMFDPSSEQGVQLLAHELAHVLQQRETGTLFAGRQPDETDTSLPDRVESTLRAEVVAELIRAEYPPDQLENLLSRLKEDARAELTGIVRDDALTAILDHIDQLSAVQADVAGQTFDYVSAVQLLVRVLGLPPGTGVTRPSYGTQGFIREVSRQIAGFLADPVYPPGPTMLRYQSTEDLSAVLSSMLEQIANVKGVLELELEGELIHLVTLRVQFEAAQNRAETAAFGAEIGESARRTLLLNSAIQSLSDDFDATIPLEDRLLEAGPQIDAIRENARTEKTALTSLGSSPRLLRPKPVDPALFMLPDTGSATVTPEEAFPATSDNATLQMLDDLSSRVTTRSSTVDSLHAEVIPQSPTYDLLEFTNVYRRWFTFFSPSARDADAFFQQMSEMYRTLYSALGMAGVEGGFGRGLMMHTWRDYVAGALGQASSSFSGDVSAMGLARRTNVSGTATDPHYEFGEMYGPGGALSGAGEDASRESAISDKASSSRVAFEGAQALQSATGIGAAQAAQMTGLIPTTRNSFVVFHDLKAQNSWNFLLRTPVITPGIQEINVYEQKEAPPEIARYLLARQQLQGTLTSAHTPGFGDSPTAALGVEQGNASASARYLHGEPAGATNWRAESDKAAISSAARKYGVEQGARPQDPVAALIQELETYLTQFFTQSTPELRIGAALIIGQVEHKIGQQFAHYFSGPELAKAIGFVIAVVGVKSVLSRFGPAGQALSMAMDSVLQLMGVTPGAAMVALAAWLLDTGRITTFTDARAQAFFSYGIADDLGQLLQQYAIQGLVAGVEVAKMRGSDSENLAQLTDRLSPMLQDAVVREKFLSDLDASIAARKAQGGGRDYTDPDLENLESVAARLRGQSEPNVRDASEVQLGVEGGTRGVDVYRMASSPVKPERVFTEVDALQTTKEIPGVRSFTRTGAENSGKYRLAVGTVPVEVTVNILPSTHPSWTAPGAQPHGGEAGPVRLVAQRDAVTGEWTATINVHDRVLPDDVRIQVGHEVDELTFLVQSRPNATSADILAETQASMFLRGGSTALTPTAHDRAAAVELAEQAGNLAALKASSHTDQRAIRDSQARVDRMLIEMGLADGFIPNDPRVQVLRDAGVPGWVRSDINTGGVGSRYQQNLRSTVQATDLVGAQATMRGVSGHAVSKHGVTPVQQAAVLNAPDRVYTGFNANGRRVDVYWQGKMMVITDAGVKQNVITAYEPDSFAEWRSRPDNAALDRVR